MHVAKLVRAAKKTLGAKCLVFLRFSVLLNHSHDVFFAQYQ